MYKLLLKGLIFTYRRIRSIISSNKVGKKKKRPRRFISPELGIEGFFKELKSEDIDYVVLRWFEDLPFLKDGEDIDILVADEDLEKIDSFLTGEKKSGIPCDIYTCSGLPGTEFKKVSYFPVHLSEEILSNSIFNEKGIKVPSPKYHLFSMLYHVVYHKGYASDLPTKYDVNLDVKSADHKYDVVLKSIAEQCDLVLPNLSLEEIDEYLNEWGWRPQIDTLKKLSIKNHWIFDHYFSNGSDLPRSWKGLSVFIVREKAMSGVDQIRNLLLTEGFDIFKETEITGNTKTLATQNIRGGNWNKGPWGVSGGCPSFAFIVYDCFPIEPSSEAKKKHPGLENQRIRNAKIKIRNLLNSDRDINCQINGIHSADNPDEALEYIDIIFSVDKKDIQSKIDLIQNKIKNKYTVIEDKSRHARRAKVEEVIFKKDRNICKTFRPGRERFLKREIKARHLGKEKNDISEILEYGDNYIILKKYDNQLANVCRYRPLFQKEKYLPIWLIKQLCDFILFFRKRGYELIDFSPYNILYSEIDGVKVIDFEFLQKGKSQNNSLKGSYACYPIPKNFNGDIPSHLKNEKSPYKQKWINKTGLPLWAFVRAKNIPIPFLFVIQICFLIKVSVNRIPSAIFKKIKLQKVKIKSHIKQVLSDK